MINSKDLSYLFFNWTERFSAFQSEDNLIASKGQDNVSLSKSKEKNNFISEQVGRAGLRSAISIENTISKTQKGFSAILQNTKTVIVRVFRAIWAIFRNP